MCFSQIQGLFWIRSSCINVHICVTCQLNEKLWNEKRLNIFFDPQFSRLDPCGLCFTHMQPFTWMKSEHFRVQPRKLNQGPTKPALYNYYRASFSRIIKSVSYSKVNVNCQIHFMSKNSRFILALGCVYVSIVLYLNQFKSNQIKLCNIQNLYI